VIARVAEHAAEYAALVLGSVAIAVGWMLIGMEVVPALVDAARMAFRAVRALFLGVGWAAAVARLLL